MHSQGLKCRKYRPIFRRYFVYREQPKRFLIHKVICWKNRKKSANIAEISTKYRNLGDISVEISTRGRHARGKHFLRFFGRYIADICRYIENIADIYRKYRRYIGDIFDISVDISVAASVAQICCAENPTAQIKPPFQTASLTDLMARFESGLIQRPRFHPDLKCDPTVKFLIQRPEIKSKLDPTAED